MSDHSHQVDHQGNSRKMSANSKYNQNNSKPLCKFFNSNYGCRYGRNCQFLHYRETNKSYNDSKYEKPISDVSEDFKNSGNKLPREREINDNICSYYFKYARCWFGNRCKFEHIKAENKGNYNERQRPSKVVNETNYSKYRTPYKSDQENNSNQSYLTEKPQFYHSDERPLCKYFKAGYCAAGHNCRFKHFEKNVANNHGFYPQKTRVFISRSSTAGRKDLFLKNLNDDELSKLRQTEVEQLLKRFTKDRITIVQNEDETVYKVRIASTDPDWPYEVSEVELDVIFPKDYPKQVCSISVSEGEYLPDGLVRYLNKGILKWLSERHSGLLDMGKVELLFRPFLRWLDQNMEDLFTNGLRVVKKEVTAKEAGIEFIPFEQLSVSQQSDTNDDQLPQSEENCDQNCDDVNKNEKQLSVEEDATHDFKEEDEELSHAGHATSVQNGEPQHRGTEAKFRSFEMSDNASTLTLKHISVTITCSRCQSKTDIKTPSRRSNTISCPKCHHQQHVRFRPSILHQHCAIVGYFDMQGAVPFDVNLMECEFLINCLSCNKDTPLTGLHYGQRRTIWCRHCNEKMNIFIDSVKFTNLQPSTLTDAKGHLIQVKKLVKAEKNPLIQEGKPLPNNGTCKHYKKSFRWLRFPCCGKCYPCDLCHDEKEKDHEMKFANRMICGFCAKEQPYVNDKPCISCNSDVINKSSSHWEGGKGCRDKIKMSKGDSQKYTSANKTVSRKAVDKKEKKVNSK